MTDIKNRKAQVQTYQTPVYDLVNAKGFTQMGSFASYTWYDDPRHLLFSMARYKFCAKMFEGKGKILEVGCGDAFGLPIMLQTVERIHGIDNEPTIVEEVSANPTYSERCSFAVHDITTGPLKEKFEAAYSLDVIEHIDPEKEDDYIANICRSLVSHGICIIGTPNVTAAPYASDISNEGHVNLKSGTNLKQLLDRHFYNSFLFSMNDEVVHTGYSPMAHYLIGMGVTPRIS
jgi:cyclopropane fatty-acyl-phospholipid synthase-like methyltransferase